MSFNTYYIRSADFFSGAGGDDGGQGDHPDDVAANEGLHGDTHSVNVELTVGDSCAVADCERVNVRHGGRTQRRPIALSSSASVGYSANTPNG